MNIQRYVTYRIFTYTYTGTHINGWAGKGNGLFFIKHTFENIIYKVTQYRTNLCTAARTDSGVHAVRNICSGIIAHTIDNNRLCNAMNYHLPDFIRVIDVQYTHACFSARFWTKYRAYEYLIYIGHILPPILSPHVLHMRSANIQLMQEAHAYLIHMQNVQAFSLIGFNGPLFRTIHTVKCTMNAFLQYSVYTFYFKARSFVHHQIRIIMHYIMQVGMGRLSLNVFKQMVHAEYTQQRLLAPPNALYLVNVYSIPGVIC